MEDIRMANTKARGDSKALKGNGTMFIQNFEKNLPYGEKI
tara:strand:- start:431 stop:550 length:120 start_codon:yes stop_codon:yes gene_type:complete